jgi:hypothetical protein
MALASLTFTGLLLLELDKRLDGAELVGIDKATAVVDEGYDVGRGLAFRLVGNPPAWDGVDLACDLDAGPLRTTDGNDHGVVLLVKTGSAALVSLVDVAPGFGSFWPTPVGLDPDGLSVLAFWSAGLLLEVPANDVLVAELPARLTDDFPS